MPVRTFLDSLFIINFRLIKLFLGAEKTPESFCYDIERNIEVQLLCDHTNKTESFQTTSSYTR